MTDLTNVEHATRQRLLKRANNRGWLRYLFGYAVRRLSRSATLKRSNLCAGLTASQWRLPCLAYQRGGG